MSRRRFLSICLATLLLMTVSFSASAAINQTGYRNGEIILVTEPDSCSPSLKAYREGWEFTDMKKATWVDGVHDKAMRLDGRTDYLEYEDPAIFGKPVTVVSWVNWRGAMEDAGTGDVNQCLFTIYADNSNYVSVNLHARVENYRSMENGTTYRIDGIYMEYRLSGSTGKHVEAFNETTGPVSYTIPQEMWTHFALVMDNKYLALYINGNKWFSKALPSGASDLKARKLRIGKDLTEENPSLNASIDDAAIFQEGLSADYIYALSSGASLSFEGETKKTNYIPKEHIKTVTEKTGFWASLIKTHNGNKIPNFTWIILGAVAVVFIVCLVIANVKPMPDEDEEEETEENLEPLPSPIPDSVFKAAVNQEPKAVPRQVAPVTTMPKTVNPSKPVVYPTTPQKAPVSNTPVVQKPTTPVQPANPAMPKPVVPKPAAVTAQPVNPVMPKPAAVPAQSVNPVMPKPAVAPVAKAVPNMAAQRPVMPPVQKPATAPVQKPVTPVAAKPAMSPIAQDILQVAKPVQQQKPVTPPTPPKPVVHQVERPAVKIPVMPSSTSKASKTMAIDNLIDDILMEKYMRSNTTPSDPSGNGGYHAKH